MLRKVLYAGVALLSCHAAYCMDYELCTDATLFAFIRETQRSNPFSIESESSSSDIPEELLAPKDYKQDTLRTQPKRKSTINTASEPKRIKPECVATCYLPGCTKIFCAATKFEVTRRLLLHIYSRKHNSEKFNAARDYAADNLRYNDSEGNYEVPCMHKDCDHILKHKNPQNMKVLLVGHLYTTSNHNQAEFIEIQKNHIKQG